MPDCQNKVSAEVHEPDPTWTTCLPHYQFISFPSFYTIVTYDKHTHRHQLWTHQIISLQHCSILLYVLYEKATPDKLRRYISIGRLLCARVYVYFWLLSFSNSSRTLSLYDDIEMLVFGSCGRALWTFFSTSPPAFSHLPHRLYVDVIARVKCWVRTWGLKWWYGLESRQQTLLCSFYSGVGDDDMKTFATDKPLTLLILSISDFLECFIKISPPTNFS